MASPTLRRQRHHTEALWERWQQGSDVGLRLELDASWRRCAASVPLDIGGAPSADEARTRDEWLGSDLRQSVERYRAQFEQIALDGEFVVAVTNPEATIMWTTGSRHMRSRAERANFAPGGRWDESSVGTNALDLALRTRQAQTVFSAEHFAPLVHQWVCYSAPIVDPRSGLTLGVLDLSTTWDRAHPLAMSTTSALASLLERDLGTMPPRMTSGALQLQLLGRGSAHLHGAGLAMTRRQLEVCALLATHPAGLSLEQLQDKLYGDEAVSLSTVKAEVSHLRQLLGGCISSRPYRLDVAVECDAITVMRALEQGRFDAAMQAYSGELMPASESPALVELRTWIEVALRAAALGSVDQDAVIRYLDLHPYDLAVAEHLARLVAHGSERFAAVAARLQRAQSA